MRQTMESELSRDIVSRLSADAQNVHLIVYDEVTSTNDVLRAAADQGAPEFTVCLAQRQSAGKGRQGRSFFSPQSGLYLSILFRPQMAPADTLALTPMAAVAAAETVEQCSGQQVQIKWVNDLLLHGRKICGILAESKFTAALDYVIVGIGINLTAPENGFPPEIAEIAGAIYPYNSMPQDALADWAAALISALMREYRLLPKKHYLEGYRQRICVLHRPIIVNENGVERPATALAVDDDLRLLVRYTDGTEQWRSTGEIRIRI